MNAIRSDSATDDRAILRRTESVMRIFDGRSTPVKEAARHHVDVAEIERWLRRARVAIAQAMRGRPTNTGQFDALPTTKRHSTGVFWASGAKK